MPVNIVRADLTKMKSDAIVNAANTSLLAGGGVCGAIFRAAGSVQMQQACNRLSPIQTGQAVLTPGFALPAKYVIHAAGPVYQKSKAALCEKQLYSAYRNSLHLAKAAGCVSIAFPLISSGIYGYPKDEALTVAMRAFKDFLVKEDMEITLCVFDASAFQISKKLLGKIESYIDENYAASFQESRRMPSREDFLGSFQASLSAPQAAEMDMDGLFLHRDVPFSQFLLTLIDQKGKSDVEVYKKANLDRRLFSKIRCQEGYIPKKATVLALAVALELNLEETDVLLERAGYALSHASKFDIIAEYFILSGIYDIYQINEVLFHYDLPLLGGK